jgi:dienelactone hydrolase
MDIPINLHMACSLLVLAGCAFSCGDSVALIVTKSPVLRGDPVSIRVENVRQQSTVTLQATGTDQYGQKWSSLARYRASLSGTVDTSVEAPLGGTYKTVAREGLFWSMILDPAAKTVTPMVSINDVQVTLTDVSKRTITKQLSFTESLGVNELPVSTDVYGYLYTPATVQSPKPALIVLGGSEGGCRRDLAPVLASKLGAPVMALAYFGQQGSTLPVSLQNIPLEYFSGAMDWLNTQPGVKKDSFLVMGISRGAELALLLASKYPERIKGVLANVPSAVIWQGEGETPDAPSWTEGGSPVPFIKTWPPWSDDLTSQYQAAITNGTPFSFRKVYEYMLAQATPDQIAAATIKVENISGPVMLLSSKLDGMWQSDVFASEIVTRLNSAGFNYPVTSYSYPSSGHLIQNGYQITTINKYFNAQMNIWMDLGGTPEGTAAANIDSWPKVIEFFKNAIK